MGVQRSTSFMMGHPTRSSSSSSSYSKIPRCGEDCIRIGKQGSTWDNGDTWDNATWDNS
jgi:hypothetical protein